MILRRHDLVAVDPAAWDEAIRGLALPRDASAEVARWVRRGRPAMVRRRLPGDRADHVPLAIQLPNLVGRLRLNLAAPAAAVAPRAPVHLAEAAPTAPPAWQGTIAAVLALGHGAPRVYGGFLWEHLTGEPVLRDGSDLDLLWHPDPGAIPALVAALARLGGAPHLDGEIVLADGAGVSWRELHAAALGHAARVAAKTIDGVALRDARAILGETAPC